jgi:hypothetical protein
MAANLLHLFFVSACLWASSKHVGVFSHGCSLSTVVVLFKPCLECRYRVLIQFQKKTLNKNCRSRQDLNLCFSNIFYFQSSSCSNNQPVTGATSSNLAGPTAATEASIPSQQPTSNLLPQEILGR